MLNYTRMCLLMLVLFVSSRMVAQVQAPGVEWQKCIGTPRHDYVVAIRPTSDGGYIALLNTDRPSGGDYIETYNNSAYQFWVVKFDSSRKIEWAKGESEFGVTIMGSSSANNYPSFGSCDIQPLNNNEGYIIIGNKDSEVPECCKHVQFVVRLDKNGNFMWMKKPPIAPASWFNHYNALTVLPDNSFVICGARESSYFNGWALKMDSNGNIIWEKTFDPGYYGTEKITRLRAITKTKDNGLLMVGQIERPAGGHTQSLWVLKLDTAGNILWQKDLIPGDKEGASVYEQEDGSLLIGYNTATGIYTGKAGVVKISSTGTVLWSTEFATITRWGYYPKCDVVTAPSGNIFALYPAYITSAASQDLCLVKLTPSGTKLWEKKFGGSGDEYDGSIVKVVNDSSILISGTASSFDGDVIGNHPGEAIYNNDAWFFNTGYFNIIKGTAFIDYNKDLVKNNNEPIYREGIVTIEKYNQLLYTIPLKTGSFVQRVDTGDYVMAFNSLTNAYSPVPASIPISFGNNSFLTDSFGFALQVNPGIKDMKLLASALTPARVGFESMYFIQYYNLGYDILKNGSVYFVKDSRTSLVSAQPAVSQVKGDTLFWNYSAIAPLDTAGIVLTLRIQPTAHWGDTLTHYCQAPIANDFFADDNSTIIKQELRAAFDPNDKTENHAGRLTMNEVAQKKNIVYLVRFQNTGNDTAFHVIVRDTVPDKLDMRTFSVIYASHPYTVNIQKGNIVNFSFDKILLPDSNVNEPGSHGYIVFALQPSAKVKSGDTIRNRVAIYFDYNEPVITQDAVTAVSACARPKVQVTANITDVTDLATTVILTAANAEGGGPVPLFTFSKNRSFTDLLQAEGSSNTLNINPATLAIGNNWIYVRMKTSESCYITPAHTDSINIRRDQTTGIIDIDNPNRPVAVYPNPFRERITIGGLNTAKTYIITFTNAQGQQVFSAKVSNRSTMVLPAVHDSGSIYWLTLYDATRHRNMGTIKLIKQ